MASKTFTNDTLVAWTDIETTGLDGAAIMEVGVILTRGHELAEIARTSLLTRPDDMQVPDVVARMDDFVTSMHTRSGLLEEYRAVGAPIHTYSEADRRLAAFMDEHLPEGVKPYLGGASITFDRSLLGPAMPHFYQRLHYRSIDLTSVALFASSVLGRLPVVTATGVAHRSLGDLEANIAQWRTFRAALAQAGAA